MFKNRRDAGTLLAQLLVNKHYEEPILLALPEGGVVIADEIKKLLPIPHAVLNAKSVDIPANPDSSVAALAPLDVVLVDPYAQESYDINERELKNLVVDTKKEMEQLDKTLGTSNRGEETYKTAILVDDGLTTLITLRAAIESVKIRYNPQTIIVVSPIIERDTAVALEAYVDEVVYLSMPDDLIDIQLWYDEPETISVKDIKNFLQ